MKFWGLTLENFRSYDHIEFDLRHKGLSLITGDNGSGKSSILSALIFCLFGIGTDSVVNNTVGGNTSVTLTGEKDKNIFAITRYRKHSKHKNNLKFFLNDRLVDATTNTDLQKKLEKFLGLDYRAFLNITAFSSDMMQFCAATDTERKAIFERILQDLDVYGEYHKYAKEEYSTIKAEVDELQHQLDMTNAKISVTKKVVEQEETRALMIEENRKEKVEALETELAELETKAKLRRNLKKRMLKYQRVINCLDNWLHVRDEVATQLAEVATKIAMLISDRETLLNSDVCPTCKQTITEEHRWEEAARLDKLETELYVEEDFIKVEAERRQKFVDKWNEINELIDEIRYKLAKYDHIPGEVKKIKANIEEEKERINDSNETIQQWKDKIRRLSRKAKGCEGRIKILETELLYLEEIITAFSKTGIPNVIISRALSLLQERTNKYLDVLSNGAIGVKLSGFATTKKGAVRNKISIEVISATGVTTYESYSGGEKQRLNISMLLALRDVAQMNKNVTLNCLFLDEVLDLSLDSQGAADVLMLMQHKKKDIDSIFIISPKEEFIKNASGNFDSIYNVQKERGFSQITEGC